MRKIDKMAREKYGGDTLKLIEHLMRNRDNDSLRQIYDDLTDDEKYEGQRVMCELAMESGNLTVEEEKNARTLISQINRRKELKQSIEKRSNKALKNETKIRRIPISNRKDNPYITDVLKGIFKLAAVVGVALLLIKNVENENMLDLIHYATMGITGYISVDVGNSLYCCIKLFIAQCNYRRYQKIEKAEKAEKVERKNAKKQKKSYLSRIFRDLRNLLIVDGLVLILFCFVNNDVILACSLMATVIFTLYIVFDVLYSIYKCIRNAIEKKKEKTELGKEKENA